MFKLKRQKSLLRRVSFFSAYHYYLQISTMSQPKALHLLLYSCTLTQAGNDSLKARPTQSQTQSGGGSEERERDMEFQVL